MEDIQLNNAKTHKKLENEKLQRHNIQQHIHPDIKVEINNCINSDQLVVVIQKYHKQIKHASMYGKAIQKCTKDKDWENAIKIMKLFVSSSIIPDQHETILFGNFFNCMAHADKPQVARKYFDVMTQKYTLIPNEVHFSTLIKGCRKQRLWELASMYFETMRNSYNLAPSKRLYTEIISVYGNAGKPELAKSMFEEYLDKVNQAKLPVNLQTFSAYLNVYSRNGDMKAVENVLQIMDKYGVEQNIIIATDIMRGYISARNPSEALAYFATYIKEGKQPKAPTLYIKCVALMRIITNHEQNFEQKYELYVELEDTIYRQLPHYRIEINSLFVEVQLSAAIALYHNVDPMRIVVIFESLVGAGYIGLRGKTQKEIDLHLYGILCTQFILRYIIGFKLNDFLLEHNELHLVVGSAKHGTGKIRQFVVHELSSYDPPIPCEPHKWNKAVLVVKKENLHHYLQNKVNNVTQKLQSPSNDWILADTKNLKFNV